MGSSKNEKNGVPCPYCGTTSEAGEQGVIDTRGSPAAIRRRRTCQCKKRFTTYERVEPDEIEHEGVIILQDFLGRAREIRVEQLPPGTKMTIENRGTEIVILTEALPASDTRKAG
ncbi:MAG: hypothetical protein Q7S16_04695 [bacterium]|nr:hypothetical protein [bacterium]